MNTIVVDERKLEVYLFWRLTELGYEINLDEAEAIAKIVIDYLVLIGMEVEE